MAATPEPGLPAAHAVQRAYVGLGANLGDALVTLRAALQALAAWPGLSLVAVSPLYSSASLPAGGPDYLNAVATVDSGLSADALLRALLQIEADHGRQRSFANAARTLDLDLLLYGQCQQSEAQLTLPHPRMHQRAFVLQPLLDLAPGLAAPGLGPLAQWLPATADQRLARLSGPEWALGPTPTMPR